MSDDLISRKALLKELREVMNEPHNAMFLMGIGASISIIEHREIAFDKEKVLKELNDTKDIPHDDSAAEITSTRIWNKAITKSIKIVEKGGIE